MSHNTQLISKSLLYCFNFYADMGDREVKSNMFIGL